MNYNPTERSLEVLKALSKTLQVETRRKPVSGGDLVIATIALAAEATASVCKNAPELLDPALASFTHAYKEAVKMFLSMGDSNRN